MNPREEWQKKARRLLMDPDGRTALKEFGIDVEMVGQNGPDQSKPIVVILCPAYRSPEPKTQDSIRAMVQHAHEKGYATVYGAAPLSSSCIHWSRNWLTGEQLKSGKPWTHTLLIDDDMVIEPDTLEKLLSHGKDIVAGIATRRSDPPIPNIRYWDDEAGMFRQIWEWPEGQTIEVDGVGMALALITKRTWEQVAQAYFDCLWEKERYGVTDEWIERERKRRLTHFDETKLAYWFRFLHHHSGPPIEFGEDMSFCFVAKRYCGLSVWVDSSVQPGHLGDYDYGVRDFLPYREIEMFKDWANRVLSVVRGEIHPVKQATQERGFSHKVSILIPTRARATLLPKSIDSLLSTADGDIEILVRSDEDDETPDIHDSRVRIISGERHGYKNLHLYYNELAEKATGDWLIPWNDDAIMETRGWDAEIHKHAGGLKVLNATGKLNLFPIVSRDLYEVLGHISLQTHSDSWLQVVGRMAGIEESVDISIKHSREEIDDKTKKESAETYNTSSPDFFTRENLNLLKADVERVKAELNGQGVSVRQSIVGAI